MTEHFFPWYLNTELLMFSWCWEIVKKIFALVGQYSVWGITAKSVKGRKTMDSRPWHKAKHRDVSSKTSESSFHEPPGFLCVRSEQGSLLSIVIISTWRATNSRHKNFRLFQIRLLRDGNNTAFIQTTRVNLVLSLISLFLPFSKCTLSHEKQIILSNPISSVKLLLETQQQNYLHYLLI